MTKMEKSNSTEYTNGAGLDVGTSFIQCSRVKTDGTTVFWHQRDAFFMITPSSPQNAKIIKNSILDKLGALYIVKDGNYYIIGKHAIEYAATLHKSALRPLKRGLLSVGDRDSIGMLSVIIKELIGNPIVPNEKCCFCYPANPIDEMAYDNIFHKDLIQRIVVDRGYDPIPILEAEAIMYSELIDEDLTGISISFGAGMTNICVSYMGENVLSFSLAKGGDYIDISSAIPLGLTDTEIMTEKESGIDLLKPVGETQEVIQSYYKNLIRYVVDNLEFKLSSTNVPKFKDPITIIISGGTSKAINFIDLFKDSWMWKIKDSGVKRDFPFEVNTIRYASDPLTSVANGCLIVSQLG